MRKPALVRRLAECEQELRETGWARSQAEAHGRQLRQALDALPQAVVIHDRDGRETLRSASARHLLASGPSGPLVAQVVEEALAAARTGRPATRTLELHGPPPRALQVSAQPSGVEGDGGALCVVEDVSERRHLEAMRRDFVANLSHELRTPVGALGVLAEAIAEEDDPEVVRRLAARIGVEVERAHQIIEALLDLSRIEQEGLPDPRPVDLAAVTRAAADRVSEVAKQREVHIALQGEAVSVPGDRRQLVSAVTNLLDNAVKYSEEDTTVEASWTRNGQWAELHVRDRGIGIPARDLDRIFERFYRVDRGRSRATGGSGLGLAIVRHVALNHGGAVSVESREGEGSTFTLRLPLAAGRD